jgi:GNAT superfamily N-acetyltransferase
VPHSLEGYLHHILHHHKGEIMIIRRATLEDVSKISGLWLLMVKESMPEATPNVEWWKDRIKRLMFLEEYFIFVSEDKGKIVGFLDCIVGPEPATSKIHAVGQYFYVLPEYRNKNLGGKIWKEMLKNLKQFGVQVLETICTNDREEFWKKRKFNFKYSFMQRIGV